MIEDDVIREVRAAREAYARLHGFNIRAMVADLQAQDLAGDWPVVSCPARRPPMVNSQTQAQQSTGPAISVPEFLNLPDAVPAVEL